MTQSAEKPVKRSRDIFNIVLLLVFVTALGYLVYAFGANIFAVIPVVFVAWILGLVIAFLRRHS